MSDNWRKKRNKESCLLSTKYHQKGRFSSHSTLPLFCVRRRRPAPRIGGPCKPRPLFRRSPQGIVFAIRFTIPLQAAAWKCHTHNSAKWPFSELDIYLQRKNKNPIAFIYYWTLKPRPLAARHSAKQKWESKRAREKRRERCSTHSYKSRFTVTYNHRVRNRTVFAQTINKIQKEKKQY